MTAKLSRAGFDVDLSYGQVAEQLVQDILGGRCKVEVKRDAKAATTKNLAVEIRCGGRLSGLSISESKFWWFAIEGIDTHIVVSQARLKEICKRIVARDGRRLVKGGDYNRSQMVLIRIQELFEV